MFHLSEKDVDEAFIFLFPAASVSDQDRHNKYGKGNLALQVDQGCKGIFRRTAFDKFRLSQVDNNAFFACDFPGQVFQFALACDLIFPEPP